MAQKDFYKIITLGDIAVGKSSLSYRYCEGRFKEKMTVGVDIIERVVNVLDKKVTVQIWDTAGEERFKQVIVSSYYRRVDGVIYVYDVTRKNSLHAIESWMREAERNDVGEKPKILIGNKKDRLDRKNSVSIPIAQNLAAKYNMPLLITSALLDSENDKIEDIFMSLLMKIYDERKTKESQGIPEPNFGIQLKPMVQAKGQCYCYGYFPFDLNLW